MYIMAESSRNMPMSTELEIVVVSKIQDFDLKLAPRLPPGQIDACVDWSKVESQYKRYAFISFVPFITL